MEHKVENELVELSQDEIALVSGGQRKVAYCVYGPNGSVGVHDEVNGVSRPASSGECGIGG